MNEEPAINEKGEIKKVDPYFPTDETKEIDLVKLHGIYKDLLYIENTNRIDVVLAAALSNKLEGIPIWLIIVGAS